MKIIIIGAGKVGLQIAQTLSRENHDITIIDKREDIKEDIDSYLDIMTVIGNGANLRTLEEAGIKGTDMLIAVARNDEINMIACMVAKQFNVASTVARVRNSEYEYMYNGFLLKEKLGIDYVINPDRATAEEIMRLLETPSNVCEAQDFADGKISLFGLKIKENGPFANKKIRDINFSCRTLVVAIFRDNNLLIPTGDYEIKTGDQVYLLTEKGDYSDLELLCNKKNDLLQNVIIFGGSNIGIQIAYLLNKIGIKTKLIEIDKQKCERISELLPHTLVINGDGTDIELLKEESIEETGGFVAVTGYDEENLLVSLLAQCLGAKKVVAKISKANYIPILEKIGIDAVVSPHLTTVSSILRLLNHGKLISLALLKEGKLEVIELVAQKNSKINNRPLKLIDFPDNTIIGAIIRNDEIIIPHGEDFIMEGDKVFLFTQRTKIKKIEHFFM